MMKSVTVACSFLLSACWSLGPPAVLASDRATPEPVAKAVGDVVGQTSASEIAGFRWGSPVATLAASKQVKPSAGFSAKCTTDIDSADRPGCSAFVPAAKAGAIRAFYATDADGLLMVESHASLFDCGWFEDIASPAAGHRAALDRMGWRYLRRDRRPEGEGGLVETQVFVRDDIAVELTFVKVAPTNVCGVKSFVSKML